MSKFKAGDKVRLHGYTSGGRLVDNCTGVVSGLFTTMKQVYVNTGGGQVCVCESQVRLRRFKKRREPREWWLHQRNLAQDGTVSRWIFDDEKTARAVAVDFDDVIRVREVLK